MTGGTFSAATTLWSNPPKLASYDMISFSCEGSTSKFVAQKPQASIDNIVSYANSGGRLLFSHLHAFWLRTSPDFSARQPTSAPQTPTRGWPIDVTINTGSPRDGARAVAGGTS